VIDRRLCVAAATALGLVPVIPAAAASPGPSALPAALADPVETGFTEMPPGGNALEGYFDASRYARATESDAKSQQRLADSIKSWGFVTGYGRTWYMPRLSDWLAELVLVFNDRTGAEGVASSSKDTYASDPAFQAFIDASSVPNAYGLTEISQTGFHWTIVIFTKENDLFAIERGSSTDFMTDQGVAQARRAYTIAPAGTNVADQTPPTSSFARYFRPIAFVAFVGALVSSAVLAVLVIIIFAPRSRWSAKP
jgi:hypothetical protein